MGDLRAFPDLDRAMEQAVGQGVFPGGVLLWARNERVFYHRGVGTTSSLNGQPVGPETVYDLASLTKPLATALAVSDLVKRNRIDLETRLGTVLPETLGTEKAAITVDMLLRHTSGLPAHREYFRQIQARDRTAARAHLRRLLLAEPLEARPGRKEVYSDLGYMVLCWVVERLAGCGLETYVRDRIYSPLGIRTLGFSPLDQKGPGWISRAAPTMDCAWRGRVIQAEVEDENAWAAGGVEGHAGLFGTAGAVHRLCCDVMRALEGNRPEVLDPRAMGAFVTVRPGRTRTAGFDTPSGENSAAGGSASRQTIGHLGFTGTSFWMDPARGLITILLTNRVHPCRENLKIRKFRPLIHDLVAKAFERIIQV